MNDTENQYDRPSKSQRKRDVHALQDLGTELVELSASQLAQFNLPERLVAAIAEAQRIRNFEGRRRQNGVCGNCGQLSHCLPDSIDAHRPALLKKFIDVVNPDRSVVAPGGTRKVVAEAAE